MRRNSGIRAVLYFLLLFFSLGCCTEIKAELADTNYETWLQTIYSREEGLAVGTANAIAATSDGIIWVGTYAGLYRYNGSRFQLMSQYESVKSVECLYVDPEDRLWVGTNDSGIMIFKDEQLIGAMRMEDGLPSDAIRSIVQGADGNYYIGTSDAMAVVQLKDQPELKTTIPEIEYADKSTADDKGNVVAISSYGTMYLIRNGEIEASLTLSGEDLFTSCVADVSGHIYAGTSMGKVYIYEVADQKFREVSRLTCEGVRKVNNLIHINAHTIFVCADNGIGYFDADNQFHMLETPNFNGNVYDVIVDYQGNLWFSSSRMGLLRLCKTSFIELFTEFSIAPSVVNSIGRYDDLLYVGTDEGLVIIDEKNKKEITNDLTAELKGIRIRQILKDRRQQLWFCTYGKGLLKYDGEVLRNMDETGACIGSRVRTILERADGSLAAASENGITCLKEDAIIRNYTKEDGLLNQINLCMLEEEDGTLLVGSDGDGIAVIRENKIRIIGKKQGLSSGVILRMKKDEAGDGIFVITSNALCYLHPDDTVTELNHFPYSNNYDILQQDDTIFVLGSSGIYVVRRDELLANREDMKYTYLDSRAGLHTALVANSWLLQEREGDKAYLATSAGVTLFDLAAYDALPSEFIIRVSSISVDGEEKSFDEKEGFSFSKQIRRLEIHPEIVNYSTVDPILSCYLEGFDKEPIVMPQSELSTIVYTNLPAGKYRFHMDVLDSESGVKVSTKVYYLERETEFTDTIWFYVLLLVALVLVITWVIFLVARNAYTRRIAEKERELEETWKISMTDELTGLKNRFAMRIGFPEYIGKQITVTMMDIDYFKNFNDTYGHEIGDRVLRNAGSIIAKYYKDPDSAYRFGGDEFLLWDLTGDLEQVEEKIRRIAEEIQKIHVEGCNAVIHISHGSAAGVPATAEELRELQNQADRELYESKKNR